MVWLGPEGEDGLSAWLPVLLVRRGRGREGRDLVVRELAVRLELDGRDAGELLCSPQHLEDMARGYVVSEGLAEARDIEAVEVDPGAGVARVRTRGGRPGPAGTPWPPGSGAGPPPGPRVGPQVGPQEILRAMEALGRSALTHGATGGTHAAGLARGGELVLAREDISRHRAVDKVLGWWAARAAPSSEAAPSPFYLVVTCRVAEALVAKAARAGLVFLASRAAPTDRAVALAQRLGLTLVGFARGPRLTVYAGPERVLAPEAPPAAGHRPRGCAGTRDGRGEAPGGPANTQGGGRT